MASVIKPKRSAVANTPPTTANIQQYEIAINTADKKIYTRDGTDNILVIGAGNVSGLADVSVSTPAAGQLLIYNSGTSKWTNGSSIGTAISITDSTASTSTTTGALKITGGVGIGGTLNVGGNVTASVNLVSIYSSGDEGGEIQLAKPQTNNTLAGSITLDIYQNKLRIFENGGSYRGVYIDLTAATGGVATNLLANNADPVTTITKSLTLSTDWQDTGINSTDLETGTYMLQLFANDTGSGGTNSNEYYSGIMSWYSGDTNSSMELPTDEIILHRAGAGGDGALYLRTYRTPTADTNNLKLQIYSNTANASAANYVFKFKKVM